MLQVESRDPRTGKDAQRIRRRETRHEAVKLRAEGKPFRAIGKELELSHQGAKNLVDEALAQTAKVDLAKAAKRPLFDAGDDEMRAYELRKAGWPYTAIGIELGVPHNTARDWVIRVLDSLEADEARSLDAVRRMELERLDAMLAGIWKRATETGELDAINTILRLMERRAKLLGLDAPIKVDLEQRLRALAIELEVDAEDLIREAQHTIKSLPGRR